MPLTGTFPRTLDQKQRIAIPKRLRDELSQDSDLTLFVAPGTDRSLSLYTEPAFEALANKLSQSSKDPASARNYLRMFYSRAERVELDGQGRVRIPERLVAFAGLESAVVLLGVHDHLELWNESTWTEFLETHSQEFDDLANLASE